jgi:acetyl/propionyl-CoA carboxylase alpha subunit
MEYKIKIEDAIHPVQVEPLGDHLYQVSFIDSTHLVDVLEISENLYSMICDGRSFEVDIVEERDIYEVFIKGRSYWGEILRPNKMPLFPDEGKEAPCIPGEDILNSPLLSKVVKVLVKEGEVVETDQVLIIIEAMKMEMPISSPIAGKIKKVLVKEGQDVDKGESLLVMTPL